MSIELTITEAGRAALINAAHTGTGPTVIAEIGLSAAAVAPAPGLLALAGEFKRIAGVGGEVVAADTIMVSAIDTSADTYSLRSFALYLADGTLFAIYGQADPILEKAAASMAALSMNVILADIAATEIAFGDVFFSNPPATTERQGIAELATLAEARAGVDAERIITPYTAKNAILQWIGFTPLNAALYTAADVLAKLLSLDGSGSGIDADLLDGLDASAFARTTNSLGFGQTWQNMAATRTRNVAYRNTTGRPIMVTLYFSPADGAGAAAWFEVSTDNATWVHAALATQMPVSVIVPDQHYYRLNSALSGLILHWAELR